MISKKTDKYLGAPRTAPFLLENADILEALGTPKIGRNWVLVAQLSEEHVERGAVVVPGYSIQN